MEEKFIQYLKEEIAKCTREEEVLILDDRKDEANLCKVRANIYDIFLTLFQVASKSAGNKENRLRLIKEDFLIKTEKIPSNWKMSYEKAKEADDAEKLRIEEAKLEIVRNIVETFQALWEVE